MASPINTERRSSPDVPGILAAVLVAMLVAATLWAGRDLHAPVAGYGLVAANGRALPSARPGGLEVGAAAPDFRLRTSTGDVIELSQLQGQPVVVQFWNTWCLDCVAGLPQIQQAHEEWGDRAKVIGIVPEESAARVREAAKQRGLAYSMALDADGSVASGYGADALPVTVVLNAEGTVVGIFQGPVSAAEIAATLDDALP